MKRQINHKTTIKLTLVSLFFIATVLGSTIGAQGSGGTYSVAGGSTFDERFDVKNVYFSKGIAPSGKGEILHVTLDIVNNDYENIPLKFYLVAFYETDLVAENKARKYNKYPTWRHRDLDAEIKKIIRFESIPEVEHAAVEDWRKNRDAQVRKAQGEEEPKKEEKPKSDDAKKNEAKKRKIAYQNFLDYVSYIESAMGEKGIDIKLQGMENSKSETVQEMNYTTVSRAMKASIWGQLYSRYTPKRRFFNHFGLVLYDTEQKKVVYRQFYNFKRKLRIY